MTKKAKISENFGPHNENESNDVLESNDDRHENEDLNSNNDYDDDDEIPIYPEAIFSSSDDASDASDASVDTVIRVITLPHINKISTNEVHSKSSTSKSNATDSILLPATNNASNDKVLPVQLPSTSKSNSTGAIGAISLPKIDKVEPYKKLYEHQIDVIKFMKKNCIDENSGCIVAHHMGLGKTLSTVAFLNSVKTQCPKALVLTRKSIVDQWVSEFKAKYDTSGLEMQADNEKLNVFQFGGTMR